MTATYTSEVAAAREYLELAAKGFRDPGSVNPIMGLIVFGNVDVLLADHARLAEENAKLRDALSRCGHIADTHRMWSGMSWKYNGIPPRGQKKIKNIVDGYFTALAALEVQNG